MFGALIGAVFAVLSEMAYIRAIRDNKIDRAERVHLHNLAHGLRWGMSLLLIASFILIVIAYIEHAVIQPAMTAYYWIFVALTLIIIAISWALSRHRISFALGSAIAFTGWWFLTYLTFGLLPSLSFGATIVYFVVATGVFYALLQYARMLARQR